jgi:hypothetical protein
MRPDGAQRVAVRGAGLGAAVLRGERLQVTGRPVAQMWPDGTQRIGGGAVARRAVARVRPLDAVRGRGFNVNQHTR